MNSEINDTLKVGDVLIAIDVCEMWDTYKETLTIGKEYIVKEIDENEFIIIDDEGDKHYFDIPDLNKYFKIKELKAGDILIALESNYDDLTAGKEYIINSLDENWVYLDTDLNMNTVFDRNFISSYFVKK